MNPKQERAGLLPRFDEVDGRLLSPQSDRKEWIIRLVLLLVGMSLAMALGLGGPPGRVVNRIAPSNWDSIQALKTADVSKNLQSEYWCVITSINPQTPAETTLLALEAHNGHEWQVVIVGDTKSPSEDVLQYDSRIHYLNVEKQKQLGYKIHDVLPYRHYGRKNIGYLYAIQNGAKVIYETDDDNELREMFNVDNNGEDGVPRKTLPMLDEEVEMLVYSVNDGAMNPYSHFGQSTIWPRGYPLSNISEPTSNLFKKATVHATIQQGLANGDPDVDAIYRLTRKDSDKEIRVSFDPDAEAVALPYGAITPFNSQNTLFTNSALWGMMIPITTAFRVCDIWRGYWAQRLNWEIGGSLVFQTATVFQDRNAHNYLADFIDEKSLYYDSGDLVDFLLKWEGKGDHFFDRVLQLSNDMVEHGFWDQGDADLTAAWLHDLIAVGYTPPAIKRTKRASELHGEEVHIEPVEQATSALRGGNEQMPVRRACLNDC